MLKKALLLAMTGASVGSFAAHAGVLGTRDAFTDGGRIVTANASSVGAQPFDVTGYSANTRASNWPDVFTSGAKITNRDGLVDDSSQK